METEEKLIDFIIGEGKSPIIKVIGVGGGGCNAVKYMWEKGIHDVGFVVCNTDYQALETSPVPNTILLGEGLGAGGNVEKARNAALESLHAVEDVLRDNTKMVFITTGMGGGTGTGASPIVAKAAKDAGILTVGIATIPFKFEGAKKREKAIAGIEELKPHVDALLIIDNDKLKQINPKLVMEDAFAAADDVLAQAAKGISEIITVTGKINRDFSDVDTVLRDSGIAIMNSGSGSGEKRLGDAIKNALNSPLLNNNDFRSSKKILMVFYCSKEKQITMEECDQIDDFIMNEMNHDEIEVIWGIYYDDALGEDVKATIISTGFTSGDIIEKQPIGKGKVVIIGYDLDGNPIYANGTAPQRPISTSGNAKGEPEVETEVAVETAAKEDFYSRFEKESFFKRQPQSDQTKTAYSTFSFGKNSGITDNKTFFDPKTD
ncbi:MAG: cell division protein FtsZ [Prevotellaceae bacterium]|jgi:cell division protein FtsZ|nr:cell division protein FtsZ [Prevotellaceae bacterium]